MVVKILRTASQPHSSHIPLSPNVALLSHLFEDTENRDIFMSRSSVFTRASKSETVTFEERQSSAKLHCLYGVPILKRGRTRSASNYSYACSIVYDLRNYTRRSLWGPFLNDGSHNVDWEKAESIMIVLRYHLHALTARVRIPYDPIWSTPFGQSVPRSIVSEQIDTVLTHKFDDPTLALMAQDPYKVTGTYTRVSISNPAMKV